MFKSRPLISPPTNARSGIEPPSQQQQQQQQRTPKGVVTRSAGSSMHSVVMSSSTHMLRRNVEVIEQFSAMKVRLLAFRGSVPVLVISHARACGLLEWSGREVRLWSEAG